MSIKPFSPQEALAAKEVPDAVFTEVNKLLVERIGNSRYVYFTLKELTDRILAHFPDAAKEIREKMITERWLDFESLYQAQGWEVEYDRPGYNESYEANFKFTAKKNP